MVRIKVVHQTVYRYSVPVEFSEHRVMCRPRDSHDPRLIDTAMHISPQPSLRWIHDAFGNWVRKVCDTVGSNNTLDTLAAISHAIKARFPYQSRHAEGTQSPVKTLTLGTDSCRDFALFMMEAVRSPGMEVSVQVQVVDTNATLHSN